MFWIVGVVFLLLMVSAGVVTVVHMMDHFG
jgi:succinate dehydrogenase / fumarate reductase cytochrome b subunit